MWSCFGADLKSVLFLIDFAVKMPIVVYLLWSWRSCQYNYQDWELLTSTSRTHWLSSNETKKFTKEGVTTYQDTHLPPFPIPPPPPLSMIWHRCYWVHCISSSSLNEGTHNGKCILLAVAISVPFTKRLSIWGTRVISSGFWHGLLLLVIEIIRGGGTGGARGAIAPPPKVQGGGALTPQNGRLD